MLGRGLPGLGAADGRYEPEYEMVGSLSLSVMFRTSPATPPTRDSATRTICGVADGCCFDPFRFGNRKLALGRDPVHMLIRVQ